MDISVVIPIYGCRAALEELHRRLTDTLVAMDKEYEIILVNDNCPQNSWEVIQQLCKKDKHVVGIELSRNFGQIQAITAGLDYSKGDWVVVMDCDLQDRPEEIPNLYKKAIDDQLDAVFARRAERKDSFMKVLVSKAFYKIYSWASDGNYDPALCNFSISKRIVVDNYCKMREDTELKLAIIELDGCIFPLNRLRYNFYKNLCKKKNITVTPEEFYHALGNMYTMYETLPLAATLNSNKLNSSVEKDLYNYLSMKGLSPKDGVIELFEYFHQNNIPIAVVSTHKTKTAINYLELLSI